MGNALFICFQLSKSNKQSLVELGENEPSLMWDFDLPVEGNENGRACFNLAQRSRKGDATVLGVSQVTTEWV